MALTFLWGCPKGKDGAATAKADKSAAKAEVGTGKSEGKAAKSEDSLARVKKKSRFPIDNLAPTTVVMRVNGQPITQAAYREWYRLRDRIYRVRERFALNEKNSKTTSFADQSRRVVPSDLIQRELMRQEAERLGVTVPDSRLRNLEKRFMGSIRRPKEPFSSIDKLFDAATAAALRSTIHADARDEIVVEKSATNDLFNVTEAEIDERIKRVKEWNATAEKKMKEQRERALKAKHDILNGGYFYDITTNRADLAKNDGREWQTVELGEFQADEPLAKWLATAKPGDISDPIDMEDGIAIVGLKVAYQGEAPPGVTPAMQYELVRCTFYAYDKIDEIEDRKELAAEMLKERRAAALQELGKRLSGSAKIEFPLGDKIFAPKAKKPHDAGKNGKNLKKKKKSGSRQKAVSPQGTAKEKK